MSDVSVDDLQSTPVDEAVDAASVARRPRRRRRVRLIGWALAVIGALALAVLGDYVVLNTRLDHVPLRFHQGAPGQTWVIVGSDSRSTLPSGRNVYGGTRSVPGERADVVLVAHEYQGRWTLISLPRDLLVQPQPGRIARLTMTLLDGPQAVLDGLCGLGIDATHYVQVGMAGFAAVVDGLGGITVHLRHPIRDPKSGLSIMQSGRVQLDGVQALALVRSRHPQQLVQGSWRGRGVASGSRQRTKWAGLVFGAVRRVAEAQRSNPIAVQGALWGLTGNLLTDDNTSLWDLRTLAGISAHVHDVPARALRGTTAVIATRATRRAVRRAGFATTCH